MPEVGLDCTRVVARIRQSKAAGMTEHVGMRALMARSAAMAARPIIREKLDADNGDPRSEMHTKGDCAHSRR
jgi:hypothetical protein